MIQDFLVNSINLELNGDLLAEIKSLESTLADFQRQNSYSKDRIDPLKELLILLLKRSGHPPPSASDLSGILQSLTLPDQKGQLKQQKKVSTSPPKMAPYPKIEVGKKTLTHLHKQPKSSKDLRVEPKSSLQLHQSQPPSSDRERPTTASNPNILPLSYLSSPSLAQAETNNPGQPYLLSRNGVGRDWLGRSGLEGGLSSEKSAPPEIQSGVVTLSNRNLEKEVEGCETSRSRKVRLDKREIELEMMVRVPTAPKAQRFKDCFPKTSNFVMLSNHHLTMPTKKAPKTTLASQSKPELSAKFKKKRTELKVHSDSKSRSKEFKNAIHKDYVQIQPNPSVPNTSLHSKKPSLTKTVEDSKTSSTQKLSSSNHKSISLQSISKAFIFVLQDNNLFFTSHQASSCTERLISTSAFRVLTYKKNKVLVVDAGIFLFDAQAETKTRLLSQDEFKIEEIYGSATLLLSLGRIWVI